MLASIKRSDGRLFGCSSLFDASLLNSCRLFGDGTFFGVQKNCIKAG